MRIKPINLIYKPFNVLVDQNKFIQKHIMVNIIVEILLLTSLRRILNIIKFTLQSKKYLYKNSISAVTFQFLDNLLHVMFLFYPDLCSLSNVVQDTYLGFAKMSNFVLLRKLQLIFLQEYLLIYHPIIYNCSRNKFYACKFTYLFSFDKCNAKICIAF